MSGVGIEAFRGHKYLNLETFRRSGAGVRTPVWFAEEGGVLFVYSVADAGKMKRLRNGARCRVAPCDWRGGLRGDWIEAEGRVVEGAEAARGQQLLREKYRPWKSIGDLVSGLRGRRQAVLAIRLAAGDRAGAPAGR